MILILLSCQWLLWVCGNRDKEGLFFASSDLPSTLAPHFPSLLHRDCALLPFQRCPGNSQGDQYKEPGILHLKKKENPYNYKLQVSIFSPGCDACWHLTASSGIFLDPLPNFHTRAWHPREFQRKHKSDKRNAAGLVLCMCASVTPTKTNESS